MEAIIALNYKNPHHAAAYGGINEVLRFYSPEVKTAVIRRALRSVNTYTEKKQQPPIKKFIPIYAYFKRELFQADLIHVDYIHRANKGIKFLLTVIDTATRRAWVLPCKNKTAAVISNIFDIFISELRQKPKRLLTDRGSEFIAKEFQAILKKHNITHSLPHTSNHAGTVERFNRTFQSIFYKFLASRSNNHYLSNLPELVELYNSRKHRIIKMSPNQAERKQNASALTRNILQSHTKSFYHGMKLQKKKDNFKIGDKVIIRQEKDKFSRGYKNQFGDAIFKIKSIDLSKYIPLYRLVNAVGEDVTGGFYEQEIQRVDEALEIPSYEIMKTRTQTNGEIDHYVHWTGHSDRFNTWIPKKMLRK
jgi:transposase InsO family protein